MKTILTLPRAVLVALALCAAGATTALAQTSGGGGGGGGSGGGGMRGVLTPAEMAQLQKAHDQAETNDPTLKTDEDALKQKRTDLKAQGANASADDKAALRQDMTDFNKKLHDAELAIDPTLAPIIAKLDAAQAKRNGGGGGGGGGQ
jgi:hypothetical protein